MKNILISSIILSLTLVGCGKSPEEKARQEKAMFEVKVQGVVKSILKDPDSAEFRNMNGICGEVNARNGFGGYTGFKKFVISKEDSQVYFETEDANDIHFEKFHSTWDKNCKS